MIDDKLVVFQFSFTSIYHYCYHLSSKMSESVLKDKSYAFAIRIVNLAKYLTDKENEHILRKQVLRSGTAIGALIREAKQGESKPDFIHKLSISLKEADETYYSFVAERHELHNRRNV